jgi:transposase
VSAGGVHFIEVVKRCFGKLKQFRAVATRYDKRQVVYQGTVDVASIVIWLRDPSPAGSRPG